MSHFTVLVIRENDEEPVEEVLDRWRRARGAEQYVAGVLAYYDENMLMPAYETPCSCGEWKAHLAAHDAAAVATGMTIADYRETFQHTYVKEGASLSEMSAAWQEHVEPFMAAQEAAFAAQDKAPDPECEECHGTGTRMSRYNANAKWDWWEIGGRWRGTFFRDGRDVGLIRDRAADASAFAVVLPDGHWVEQGSMGWWAVVTDGKDESEWAAEQEAIFERYGDHIGILVDCHI